jgi:competence protein ComEA
MFKKVLAFFAAMSLVAAFAAVDVNKASDAELDGIKGIGPATSKQITAERKKGEFKNWDDFITRVKGVGEKNAAKFSAEGLTVGGAAYTGPGAADAKAKAKTAKADVKADTKADAKTDGKKADKTMGEKTKDAAVATKDAVKGAAIATKDAVKDTAKDAKTAVVSKKDKAEAKADAKADAKAEARADAAKPAASAPRK